MVAKVTLNPLGSFGAILGSFWCHFGTIPGQFVATNSKLSQTSHVTTQNDRKRSRILMEMVAEVTLNPLRTFGAILGSFWGHFGTIPGQFVAPNSELLQTSHVTTQNDRKRSRILMEMFSEVTLNLLRSFGAILGSFSGHLETIPGHF